MTELRLSPFNDVFKRVPALASGSVLPFLAFVIFTSAIPLIPENDALGFLLYVASFYTGVLWSASMYRIGLRRGKGYRSFLKDVTRLVAGNLLIYFAAGMILFFVALFIGLFSMVLAATTGADPSSGDGTDISGTMQALQDSGMIWLLYSLMATTAIGIGWFAIRLLTFGAATVSQKEIRVFQTWPITKPLTSQLLIRALILQVLPFAALFTLAEVICLLIGLPTFFRPDPSFGQGGMAISIAIHLIFLAPFWIIGHSFAISAYKQLEADFEDRSV